MLNYIRPSRRPASEPGDRLPEKKWAVRDGKPRCRHCDSLLQPIDEPLSLKCASCGWTYQLTEDELAELTFDLSD